MIDWLQFSFMALLLAIVLGSGTAARYAGLSWPLVVVIAIASFFAAIILLMLLLWWIAHHVDVGDLP